jgi:hypothetical protein
VSQRSHGEPLPNSEEVSWRLVYTKQAQKDAKKLASSNLKEKAEELLVVIKKNPFLSSQRETILFCTVRITFESYSLLYRKLQIKSWLRGPILSGHNIVPWCQLKLEMAYLLAS